MLKRKHKSPKIKMAVDIYVLPLELTDPDHLHEFLCTEFTHVRREYANLTWWSVVGLPPVEVYVGAWRDDSLRALVAQVDYTPADVKFMQARAVVRSLLEIGAKPFCNGFEITEAVVEGREVPELVHFISIFQCSKCNTRFVNAWLCPNCGRQAKSPCAVDWYPADQI